MISEMDGIEKSGTNLLGVDMIGVVVRDKTTVVAATRHQDIMRGEGKGIGTGVESMKH